MWKDLTIGQKSEVMHLAVQQGFSDLNNIKEMYDAATSVYNTSSNNTYDNVPYNPSPKDVRYAYGGPLGNIYKGKGNKSQQIYVSSPSIRRRISNWEGESMYKPAPDTGKVNNPFEKEDAAFWSTIPTNIRPYLTQDMLDALYSTSYNIGSGNFKKRVVPELKKFFIDGTGSIEAIKNSMYGTRDKEAGMSGLRTRRVTERAMFENAFNAEYPNGYRTNRTPNLPVERTSQKTGWDKNKSAKENLDSTLYIDPKAPIYEALTKAGVHFMTTNPSGYRTPQQQKRFKTKNSQHTHKREDGTGWAMDATPGYITENGKTRRLTWDEFRSELTHPALQRYFAANGMGVYDETTPTVMKKTGATGQHFHIGRDAYGPKGTMTTTYNNWVSKFRQPAITMDTESPVFHTTANDLQWQPPIVASSRQEDIAPLLVQDNKPLIVEPLEDTSSTPKDFSAIWDQIFPKVENTQEEFNPLLDPSTQFTALQSRPRYQMKPTPIINMSVSDGDNDYILFRPLT